MTKNLRIADFGLMAVLFVVLAPVVVFKAYSKEIAAIAAFSLFCLVVLYHRGSGC